MIDSIGGRKVAVIAGTVLICTLLVLWKGDVPANYLSLLEWAVGFFVIGNGIEHGCRVYGEVNGGSDEPAAPGPQDNAVRDAFNNLSSLVQAQAQQEAATQQAVITVQQMLGAICKKYNII